MEKSGKLVASTNLDAGARTAPNGTMNTCPYLFQLQAARAIQKFKGRCIVSLPLGSGKSLTALLWHHRHPVWPLLIICPAALRWNWQREAMTHFGLEARVLEGGRSSSLKGAALVIINYDILGKWFDELAELNPQLIVIDEGHYCGNPQSQRSRAVKALCQGVPHVLVLTGTPIMSKPIQIWPLCNITRPHLYPSRFVFAQEFCAPKRNYGGGWDYSGASNLDVLHQQLQQHVMIYRSQEDVLPDLPKNRRIVVPLEISNRAEYQEAHQQSSCWYRGHSSDALTRAERVQGLALLTKLLTLTGRGKLPPMMGWLDNWLEAEEGKLIFFVTHIEVINKLHQNYPKTSVLVDGSVTGKTRQDTIDRFLADPKIRILFGNLKAAGVGWNARGVGTVAFGEYGWLPAEITQAIGRAVGIGRGVAGQRTNVYFLVGQNTIEEKMLKLIQARQKMINEVMDGISAPHTELNIYDELVQEILKEEGE